MIRLRVRVPAAGATHPLIIGRGVLSRLPRVLAAEGLAASGRRAVLVTDARLRRTWGRRVEEALARGGWRIDRAILPPGEAGKTFGSLRRLYRALGAARAERRTVVVAVGGGAVGDTAAFAAATYARGLPLVHVPTTLLAQLDSAVGGKAAVDLDGVKNAVGLFHWPAVVLCDVDCLTTLPERDFRSGLAEAVKCGLALDPSLARWLASAWEAIVRRDRRALVRLIRTCLTWKAHTVAADPWDLAGRRAVLNFGHTVGHALEAASRWRLRHGEAVAWGMRAALMLSRQRGGMANTAERRLAETLLARLAPPAWPLGATPAAVLAHLAHDKKVRRGRNVFVLLRRLGHPVLDGGVSLRDVAAVLEALRKGETAWTR